MAPCCVLPVRCGLKDINFTNAYLTPRKTLTRHTWHRLRPLSILVLIFALIVCVNGSDQVKSVTPPQLKPDNVSDKLSEHGSAGGGGSVDKPPAPSDTPDTSPQVTAHDATTVQAPTHGSIAEAGEEHLPMPGLKGLSSDAILRGFYVLVGVGTIVLVYIVIKLVRLRRRRATRKYRVLAQHTDDQEMFPLAADDADDDEIFNAADHHAPK